MPRRVSAHPMTRPSVAAVTLTRNRKASLLRTLAAIGGQSCLPDETIVVDNGSDDGTPETVVDNFPAAVVVTNGSNLGAAAGRSRGLVAAFERGHDLVWLVDDDTVPSPDTLERSLEIAATIPSLGMLGQHGGLIRRGLIRHGCDRGPLSPRSAARAVDFVLTDGALVTRAAYERAGTLDGRYFIMMEDIDYPLRVRRAGLTVAQADLGFRFQHLGAAGGVVGGPSAPWRLYYQTRNHLRMALDHRSPALLFGWLYRQVGGIIYLVRQPDRRSERLRLRLRGAIDGLRGRMGLVVAPPHK
jgi:GT2 family glycosyltransferase